MRENIVKEFDAELSRVFREKPDILKFLLKHERKEVCIVNLCGQVANIERRSYSITFDITLYKSVVHSVARMFAEACLLNAQSKTTSSIEKIRQQTEVDKEKQVEEMIKQFIKDGEIIDRTTTTELGADGAPEEEVNAGT